MCDVDVDVDVHVHVHAHVFVHIFLGALRFARERAHALNPKP